MKEKITKNIKEEPKNQNILLYKNAKGNIELRADVEKETIWATQSQIAELFDVLPQAITKHIANIYKQEELDRNRTCSKMEQVRKEGVKAVKRSFETYNLDVIIAVGYRVNSKKATGFRIWATQVLREYLVKGAVLNTDRIKKLHEEGIKDLEKKITFIQETIKKRLLDQNEVDGLLSVIRDYASSWSLLQKYDEGGLQLHKGKTKSKTQFDYDFVRPAIDALKLSLIAKGEASDLFGTERDHSFSGILNTIYQTFDGKELYASLEEKAAHLLYFVIKDHPFSDGNKRVGSFLFVYFLERNALLYRASGEKKIADNMLVALALLIAESDPKEKEMMVALVTNLIG